MPDPRLLKTFLAVAAGLSFRQAAKDLHYAPSSVSSQIKALEEELGVPLFDRAGRLVVLTEQGRRLLGHARRLTELTAQTRRIVTGGEDAPSELTVRLSESLGIHCLPQILPHFRKRFPETRLRLATQSRYGLARDLLHGMTDLAVVLGEPFRAAGVTVEVMHHEPLVVIVAANSPLAGRGAIGPRELEGMPLLLTPHVWSARRFIEEALLEARVSPSGLIECSSVEIVKRCVMAGQGISVAPRFTVAEEVARGALAALDWSRGTLDAPVLLVRHADREPSAPASVFVEAIRAVFAAQDNHVRRLQK
jgi:DNA-binding transcriptional LysR family regulator